MHDRHEYYCVRRRGCCIVRTSCARLLYFYMLRLYKTTQTYDSLRRVDPLSHALRRGGRLRDRAVRSAQGARSVEVTVRGDLLDLGKLPLAVAQRAHGARLQPARDAIEVEDVPAAAPRNAVASVVGKARVCGGGAATVGTARVLGAAFGAENSHGRRQPGPAAAHDSSCWGGACDACGEAHWLGPRYWARTACFGKWRKCLRHTRVARLSDRSGCGAQGGRGQAANLCARVSGAGGRAHQCRCPTTRTSPRSCVERGTGAQARASPRSRAARPPRSAETQGTHARRGAAHHFFTTKRGPSLLSLSTSISSSSAMADGSKLRVGASWRGQARSPGRLAAGAPW